MTSAREDRLRLQQPPRRDAEPHRGNVVLSLGILSLVAIPLLPPLGILLGLMAWVMGQNDLRQMRQQLMDDSGQASTQAGWVCGIAGTLLNVAMSLACLGFGISFLSRKSQSTSSRPLTTRVGKPPVRPGPVPPNW